MDEQGPDLLRGAHADAPDRQRTLRSTIRWSYDLLSDEEQVLFRRLGIFVGGFTLPAAREVVGDGTDVLEGIASLADESLLRRSSTGASGSRYELLETIREFAVDEMRSRGELDEVARRHARHFLALGVEAEPHLTGAGQVTWLGQLEVERDDLRAAFAWAREHAPVEGAQAAGAMWRFFQFRSHLREGTSLLEELLAHELVRGEVRAKALVGLAGLVYWQADYGAAVRLYEEALAIYEQLGDRANVADNLYNLSTAYGMARDLETGRGFAERSLAAWEEIGDEVGIARTHMSLAWYRVFAGEYEEARASAEHARTVFSRHGMRYEHATAVQQLGFVAFADGNVDSAWPAMVEALDIYEELGDRTSIATVLDALATLAATGGNVRRSLLLAGAAERIRTEIEGGVPTGAVPLTDWREIVAESLTDEEIEAGLDGGRQLTYEEALAEARRT